MRILVMPSLLRAPGDVWGLSSPDVDVWSGPQNNQLFGGESSLQPVCESGARLPAASATPASALPLGPPSCAERLEQPQVLCLQRAVAVGQVEEGQHAGGQGGQRPVVVG